MLSKEDLLKLLNKFGYDSLTKEPFLYEKNLQTGFYYTFKDPIYGYLNRVYLPKNLDEATEFLNNYYNYKKNDYTITLDNYSIFNPKPTFREPIKKENLKKDLIKPKEKRTALLLIEILKQKCQMWQITIKNVKKMIEKYEQTKQEWLKNCKGRKSLEIVDCKLNLDNEQIINPKYLEEQIKTITKETIETFINNIIFNIKNLEKSDNLLKSKYLLIKIPLEIELLEKQITLMKKRDAKEKGIFSRKTNLVNSLENLENESNRNKIVLMATYIDNEKKRIDEKYEMINEMDINTIADYLMEFDNLEIKEPILDNNIDNTYSYEQAIKYLENTFNNRKNEEQNQLYLIGFLFKYLLKDQKDSKQYIEQINNLVALINNYNNIFAKIKFFKDIDLTSPKKFVETVKEKIDDLEKIKVDTLKADIHVFFKCEKKLNDSNYIIASSKKSCMPITNNLVNPVTFIATLKKNALFYFLPNELAFDITNEEQLQIKENNPLFIINGEKNIVKNKNSDIIKVAKFQIEQTSYKNCILVTDIKKTYDEQYQEIIIERI